jgi:general secretion pathway protein B
MSIILDAIKRSKEVPEGGGSVPSLDTDHYVAPDEPLWRTSGFKLASVAAFGVMVVVLVVLYLFERDGSDASDIKVGVSTEAAAEEKTADAVTASPKDIVPDVRSQAPLTSSPPVSGSLTQNRSAKASNGGMRDSRPIVIPTETQPPMGSVADTEKLSSLYAAMNKEAEAELDLATVSEAETATAPDLRDQVAEVSEASEVSESSDESAAVDFAEILARAQKELGVQPLVESDEPLLETLSQQVKDQIPSLIYSEHNYSANGRSEVVLNGKTLRERQRVGPFTVVEILPDSVILRWRETQFRVRARNSWINM